MLTPEQLAVAVRANMAYRVGVADWPILASKIDPHSLAGSANAFAQRVADFQAAHPPLVVDGAMGPKTQASVRGVAWTPPLGQPRIIAGGKDVPAPGLHVVAWSDPGGLSFKGEPGWSPRGAAKVDLIVLHHDGARTSHGCYQTLLARDYAVQFMLDAPDARGEVVIYQALDAGLAIAYHAGPVNARSVGVEICNPVDLALDDPKRPRPRVPVGWPQFGDPKAIRLGFYPEQVVACRRLVDVLCDAFGVPRALPGKNGVVAPTKDTRVAAGIFKGVCAHAQISSQKWDPCGAATQLWPGMIANGYVVS